MFTVVRLVQRRPLTQALAGVVGVGISAWFANSTGKAEDFYLPGFLANAAYITAMVISIAVKWPIAGLLFGFIRNEGLDWRRNPTGSAPTGSARGSSSECLPFACLYRCRST